MAAMKKLPALFLILLLSGVVSIAQEPAEAYKEVFADAEYFLASEYYADALPEYMKLYKRGFADNANLNYRIGICYLNIPGNKAEAIPYFQKAVLKVTEHYTEGVLKETNAPYDAFLYLGNAYRINNELDKAILAYNKYMELIGPEKSEMLTYAQKQVEACKVAQKMQQLPVPVDETNLGAIINNSAGNYRPAISGDESTLAYMNHLKFYDAVYLSRKVNGVWSEPENLTPQIMSDGDQFTCALSYDGKLLLLTKEDQFNSDIFYSEYIDKTWTPSRPYNKNINTKFWESHASLTKDGKRLYFASNRNGGQGEMDIYYSDKLANGEWGPAVNIGPVINTPLSEDSPFITADGKTLFFASQGHENMGGFDLFKSDINANGEWSAPVNLGFPVNKTDDDLFFVPVGDGSSGYMALYEKTGFGDQDIYKLTIHPRPVLITEKEPAKEEVKQLVAVTETPKDTAKVTETITPVAVVEETETEVKEPVIEKVIVENKNLPEASLAKITLSPLFFEFNQAGLNTETRKVLDLLVKGLNLHSAMKVEITGHTDSKGSEEYNQNLGLKRAEIVKNYLTTRGISADRISVKSLGELKPVAINANGDGTDNPEGRKLNRRVEFRITAGDNGMLLIETVVVPADLRIQ
ncbi:MAG: OmpA family protein [Bacteroidales bacterium]